MARKPEKSQYEIAYEEYENYIEDCKRRKVPYSQVKSFGEWCKDNGYPFS